MRLHLKGGVLTFLFCISIFCEENPWSHGLFKRIINRKHINHLILETRIDHYRLTLIVSDRFPYNYKSAQYPFFFRFKTLEEALKMQKIFDKHLDSGEEIKLFLEGSQIMEFELLGAKKN
ncbi:MAG: hypothetical protein SFU98_17420 [Leptospiraceae bacterium]|nr:hypothetical protein [Leptospiraceae bacterium]